MWVVCSLKGGIIVNEENVSVSGGQDKVDANEADKSEMKKSQGESSGEWGSRKGNKFTFNVTIEDVKGALVYPLAYKNIAEETLDDGKILITLKLSGQKQEVKFYKDVLYEKFGMKTKAKGKSGRKQRNINLTDEEFNFVKAILLPIFSDDHCFGILKSKTISDLKAMLGVKN